MFEHCVTYSGAIAASISFSNSELYSTAVALFALEMGDRGGGGEGGGGHRYINLTKLVLYY